jgi:DNA repair exonuclease SbcCD ATPase subunit
MDLVDFILSNPLVIAGFIFVLSSLFGKKKKGKKQRRQMENPASAASVPVPSIDQTANQQAAEERLKEAIDTIETRYHSAKNEMSELGNEIGSAADEIQAEIQTGSKKSQLERTKANPVINKDNVVQGIIWSEILGSPRSKKPHASAKRRV